MFNFGFRESAQVQSVTKGTGTAYTSTAAGFAVGVTDYMTKPFAVPMVRARVRSWLTRAAAKAGV